MIILDTNVVSEPLKPGANPVVESWLDQQVAETLYLTATSLAELRTGVEYLPNGKRRTVLNEALCRLLASLFTGRILAFDEKAANTYARLVSRARPEGRVLSVADAQIAAIAMVHGFTVATRDTTPFMAAGVPIINPWES